jgi:hypothetical protein
MLQVVFRISYISYMTLMCGSSTPAGIQPCRQGAIETHWLIVATAEVTEEW